MGNGQIWNDVNESNPQFFPNLPPQAFLGGFARFNLPAGEFP